MASSADRYIGVLHVAKRLGIKERTVRHRASRGRLPGVKIGPRIWRFRVGDIEALTNSSRDPRADKEE